jgi:hypothetical protein
MGSHRSAERQSGLCRIYSSRTRGPASVSLVDPGRRTGGCSECHERKLVPQAMLHIRQVQGFRDLVKGAEGERRPARLLVENPGDHDDANLLIELPHLS